jgi:hypothetical protein
MARADLRALVGNLGATEVPRSPGKAVSDERTAVVEAKATARAAPERSNPGSPSRAPSEAHQPSPIATRYSDFQRKETRLRADQQNALTEHARRVNRAKGTSGARITDNTLIRVAVDLLLSKADKLAGRNEAELGRSLGLRDE